MAQSNSSVICVMRLVNGVETICPLDVQWSWKEWCGAFSLLPVANKEKQS
jgi:hypothetical protein